MKSTAFDVHIRTLECDRCGAPIATGERGGQVTCAYCGVVNVVETRRVAAGAGTKRSMADEVARLSRLKAQQLNPVQAHAYDLTRPPVGFRTGETQSAEGFERAVREWREGRATAEASSPEEQRARCWLALELADGYQLRAKPLEARAVLETALDALPDEGHRHLVRCRLAVAAIEQGDLPSAGGWLDECDPAPEVLELDSAYREARARLHARHGDGPGVLRQVGASDGDIPFAREYAADATLLRVHGLELSGRDREADAALDNVGYTFSPLGVVPTLAKRNLAPKAARRLTQRRGQGQLDALSATRARYLRSPLKALVPALTALPLLAAVCMIPVSVSRCSLDADPLMGVYGYALCPKVCDGCHGRVRVVTAWQQTGPGEYSSDGAEYFCPSDTNGVANLSDEQLERATSSLGAASLNFLAAAGASYLLLLLLLSPFVPLSGTLRWLRHRAELQRLDAEVDALAAQLGLAAPYPPAGPGGRLGPAVLLIAVAAGGALALVLIGLAVG